MPPLRTSLKVFGNSFQSIEICSGVNCTGHGINVTATESSCCCNKKTCQRLTFEAVLALMKESSITPHVVNFEDQAELFNGDLKSLKIPLLSKKNLTDLPPIFAKKAPTGREAFKRFLNLEPFIPICKLANKLTNKNPRSANQDI